MKHMYIDSRLDYLTLAAWMRPRRWIFSQGRPWLLLTPDRLSRLAFRIGLEDHRIERLVDGVRRYAKHPDQYCRPLGLPAERYYEPGDYPPALCPVCDGIHQPHPLDVNQPCEKCVQAERSRIGGGPTPGMQRDVMEDEEARKTLGSKEPSLFCEGELSPNWRMNFSRRVERDWDAAINRILMGATYRAVAREFACSVGLLHKKVKERNFWEDN